MTSKEPTAVRALEYENNLPNPPHSAWRPTLGLQPIGSGERSSLLPSRRRTIGFRPERGLDTSNINSEVADDFEVVDNINRVLRANHNT